MRPATIIITLIIGLFLVGCDVSTSLSSESPSDSRPAVDTDSSSIYGRFITDIDHLSVSGKVILNSHSDDCNRSSLELNCRSIAVFDNITTTAVPRLKQLADGSYLLFYLTTEPISVVGCVRSEDMVTWTEPETIFSPTICDGRICSSADAFILADGDILVFAAFSDDGVDAFDSQKHGVVMRRSTDNGKTWSKIQVILSGFYCSPFALQLDSGEIQLYVTDYDPGVADTEISLIRSYDNGMTWSFEGSVVRRMVASADDGTGRQLCSDQSAAACVLNKSQRIAVATESITGLGNDFACSISMAWDDGRWSCAPLSEIDEGPAERAMNVLSGEIPSLVQFPSGETILACMASGFWEMCMGNADAKEWTAPFFPFTESCLGGSMTIINPHTLVVATITGNDSSSGSIVSHIQTARFHLNHRINAEKMTPEFDGSNVGWSKVEDALFIGSQSQAQVMFRFAYDSENLYCLVERSDTCLTFEDVVVLYFQGGDGVGSPLCVELIPEPSTDALRSTPSSVSCRSTVVGAFGASTQAQGYIAELAIPRVLLRTADDKVLFNATLYDALGSDTFTGLTATNYERWLPIVLGADSGSSSNSGGSGNNDGPSWGNGDDEHKWH